MVEPWGDIFAGENDTPLVTVSEVNAITLSNSELASFISFIPRPTHLCIQNHSHSLQLRAQTFSARPL